MAQWPDQNTPALNRFYGNPVGAYGQADPEWVKDNLMLIPVPYRMVLAWDAKKLIKDIWIHHKCGVVLDTCLKAILGHYKTQEDIEAVGMHLFGGSFTYRTMRGSNRLSMHAYGCAIDLDPNSNKFGSHKWSMPKDVVRIFESTGATWGGHWRYPDAMHFQWANI